MVEYNLNFSVDISLVDISALPIIAKYDPPPCHINVDVSLNLIDANRMFFIATTLDDNSLANLNNGEHTKVLVNLDPSGGFTPNFSLNGDGLLKAHEIPDVIISREIAWRLDAHDISVSEYEDFWHYGSSENAKDASNNPYRLKFNLASNQQQFQESINTLFCDICGTATTTNLESGSQGILTEDYTEFYNKISQLHYGIANENIKSGFTYNHSTDGDLQQRLKDLCASDASFTAWKGILYHPESMSITDAATKLKAANVPSDASFASSVFAIIGTGPYETLIDISNLINSENVGSATLSGAKDANAKARGAFKTDSILCLPLTFQPNDTINFNVNVAHHQASGLGDTKIQISAHVDPIYSTTTVYSVNGGNSFV